MIEVVWGGMRDGALGYVRKCEKVVEYESDLLDRLAMEEEERSWMMHEECMDIQERVS